MYKKAPAWSIPSGKTSSKLLNTPGPGAYTPVASVLPSSPAFSIGKSKRKVNYISYSGIGPGAYTPIKHFSSRKAIFGSSPKSFADKSSFNPGPGQYKPRISVEGPFYSIQGKNEKLLRSVTPGPGRYQNSQSLDVPSYKFGREKKFIKISGRSPGPGSYEITYSKEHKGIVFARQKRETFLTAEGPGPGSYDIPTITDPKAFSFIGKPSPKSDKSSPGPGRYNTAVSINQKAFSIGKSKRFLKKSESVPGPGAYNTGISFRSSSAIFGSSKREINKVAEKSPGPGDYKIPDKSIEGPSFSMRNKVHEKNADVFPGPGAYNIPQDFGITGQTFYRTKIL